MHNNRNNRETVIIPQTIIVPPKSIIVESLVDEQGRRLHIGELGSRLEAATQSGQHSQGKRTDICSLSFGHSLSPLSYSTSKLTLLHSNAAPAPPPNCTSSIGYSTCKTS